MLCTLLLLLVNIGTIKAAEPGYTVTEYYMSSAITADGKWTTADEWHDAPMFSLGTPKVAVWEYKMDSSGGSGPYVMEYLIEFADHTNDPGDRWQICLDGLNDGGTAPKTDDIKFEIEGHTTLKTYNGNGVGWTAAAYTPTWKDNLTSSPHDPAIHYVFEMRWDKGAASWGANTPPHGLRIAMYDASNPSQGWVAWPPEAISKDNPSRWGAISGFDVTYPEGLTIPVMLLVSAVAMLAGSYYLRKRPKTTNLTPTKL